MSRGMSPNKPAAGGENDREPSATSPLLKARVDGYQTVNGATGPDSEQVEDSWDAKDNHANPRNWKGWFKWVTVALVSFIEFLT